jgi:hypothetical protein
VRQFIACVGGLLAWLIVSETGMAENLRRDHHRRRPRRCRAREAAGVAAAVRESALTQLVADRTRGLDIVGIGPDFPLR